MRRSDLFDLGHNVQNLREILIRISEALRVEKHDHDEYIESTTHTWGSIA